MQMLQYESEAGVCSSSAEAQSSRVLGTLPEGSGTQQIDNVLPQLNTPIELQILRVFLCERVALGNYRCSRDGRRPYGRLTRVSRRSKGRLPPQFAKATVRTLIRSAGLVL